MTETQTQKIEFVVYRERDERYIDLSTWLADMETDYAAYQESGWRWVETIYNGIERSCETRAQKSAWYQAAQEQNPKMKIKRMQNLVSMRRKPYAKTAQELGLEIAHVEAVLGLPDDAAEAMLIEAAEQGLHATAVGARIREERQRNVKSVDLPDAGNEDNNMHDVPFSHNGSNVLYEQGDDYSAEANAYAGSHDGYDWSDDDELMLNRNEARDMIEAAWRRLPADDEQRTLGEWLSLLLRNAY